jgi:hypothetical protein
MSNLDASDNGKDTKNLVCSIKGKITCAYGPVPRACISFNGLTTLSDGNGIYEIKDLVSGEYEIIATPPIGWDFKTSTVKIEVNAGEERIVDIYLERQTGIIEGHIFDEENKPLEGATISVLLFGSEPTKILSDKDGNFKFEDVNIGDYFLRVKKDGYVAEGVNVTVPSGDIIKINFNLKRGFHRIYGRICNDENKPLEADIYFFKREIVLQRPKSNRENGEYEIKDLEKGTYELFVSALGHQPRGWRGEIDGDIEVNFTLPINRGRPPDKDLEGML